jgi:hypothetical protein
MVETLSREEIMDLPAGWRINGLVCEHVLRSPVANPIGEFTGLEWTGRPAPDQFRVVNRVHCADHDRLFDPSTDMGSAWLIWKRVPEIQGVQRSADGWYAQVQGVGVVPAGSPMLAICRGALLAVLTRDGAV